MGFAMEVNDDPNASLTSAIVFAAYAAAFALLAAYLFLPLLSVHGRDTATRSSPLEPAS
jgi:hypothetical protein